MVRSYNSLYGRADMFIYGRLDSSADGQIASVMMLVALIAPVLLALRWSYFDNQPASYCYLKRKQEKGVDMQLCCLLELDLCPSSWNLYIYISANRAKKNVDLHLNVRMQVDYKLT